MSNITDRAPRRIPEWLSLQDIARAWNEETGEDAAAFEAAFRGWFKDYLLRNAYGDEDAGGEDGGIPEQLLEGRQIWRDTFETFCEDQGRAKPRFWFPEGGRAPAAPQPVASEPVPIADAELAESPEPPNQNKKEAPSRRRAREGGASFTWIAAGLVVAVIAGLATLWLQDLDAPVVDADLLSGAIEQARMSVPAPAPPAEPQAAASLALEAATPAPTSAPTPAPTPVATPAPTTVSDPAAAQIAANPAMANQAAPSAAPPPEEAPAAGQASTAGQAMAQEPVDRGLVLLLQRELQAAGYDPGPLDGVAGSRFAAAVAGYQRANELYADGRASIGLLSRLARENLKAGRMAPFAPVAAPVATPAPETAPSTGSTRTAARSDPKPQTRAPVRAAAPRGRALVRAIQKRLSDRGYYDGPLDGSLGPKTHKAIQKYQRVQRYTATGQPSRAIYEELQDYALEVRGLAQFQKGAYDAAVVTYSRIIRRKPKYANAYFNRGLAHKNLGRTAQALTDYDAAIELDPAHRKAYFDRANILYEQGFYGDALGAYYKALKLFLNIG